MDGRYAGYRLVAILHYEALSYTNPKAEVALRRGTGDTRDLEEGYDDGFLRLDFHTLTVVRNGEHLVITPNEYKLLRLLISHAGNLVIRQIFLKISYTFHMYVLFCSSLNVLRLS